MFIVNLDDRTHKKHKKKPNKLDKTCQRDTFVSTGLNSVLLLTEKDGRFHSVRLQSSFGITFRLGRRAWCVRESVTLLYVVKRAARTETHEIPHSLFMMRETLTEKLVEAFILSAKNATISFMNFVSDGRSSSFHTGAGQGPVVPHGNWVPFSSH